MRYNHFSMLPDRAFTPRSKVFASGGMTLEGGGSSSPAPAPQPSNISQTTIPEYAQPYMENLLGKAEALTASPYQTYGGQRIAAPSTGQLEARADIAGLQAPDQFNTATNLASAAGLQALSGSQYNPAQFSAQQVSAPWLNQYQMGPAMGVSAQQIGAPQMATAQTGYNPQLNMFQLGAPGTFGAEQAEQYMSPYVQNVLDIQKREAVRDAQKAQLAQNLSAARQGTYGGARQLLATTERERALGQQLGDIEARGLQYGYENAQQQFERDRAAGLTAGAQNLQAALGVQQLGTQTGLQTSLANLSAAQQANVQNQAAQLQAMGMNQEQALRAALANQQAGLTVGQANLQAMLGTQQLGSQQYMQSQLANQQYGLEAQRLAEMSRQFGGTLGLQGAQTALQSALGLGTLGGQQQQSSIDLAKAQEMFGSLSQQQQQSMLDMAYQDFLAQQRYPYTQLGFMSDLLRGSGNLASTGGTAVYSAPPSTTSQLLGLGSTLGGAYLLGGGTKTYKEGGEVKGLSGAKNYAEGGSVVEDMIDVAKLNPDQIKQTQQSGARPDVPDFVLLAELDRKLAQIEAAKAQGGLPQATVAEDIRTQAAQEAGSGGLNAIPLPDDYYHSEDQVAKMAGGGIIAFSGGTSDPMFVSPDYEGEERAPMGYEAFIEKLSLPELQQYYRDGTVPDRLKGSEPSGWGSRGAPLLGGYKGYSAPNQPGAQATSAAAAPTKEAPAAPKQGGQPSSKTEQKVQKAEDAYEKKLRELLDKTEMSEDDKRQALGFALVKAGAKAMGGKSQYAMQNIAEGVEAGADDYVKALNDAKKDKKELTKTLAEYGLAKEKIGVQREQVAATERNTASQIEGRKDVAKGQLLERLSKQYESSMFAGQKPQLKDGAANPNYKPFENYLREKGYFKLYPEEDTSGGRQTPIAERAPIGALITPR